MIKFPDIETRRAYYRDWYLKNKERQYARISENNKRLRKERKDWLAELKRNLKCISCGENHPACLQFHHKDKTDKLIDVSEAVKNCWSIRRIKEEIEKCEVLCANCHAKLHYEENQALAQLV